MESLSLCQHLILFMTWIVITSHLLKQEWVWSVVRRSAAAAGEDTLVIYLQNEVKAGPKNIYNMVKIQTKNLIAAEVG
jgi:hypothetical protein